MSRNGKEKIKFDPMGRRLRNPVIQMVSRQEEAKQAADVEAGWVSVDIKKKMDLAEVREKLSERKGRGFWKGLEELADNKGFKDLVRREFPRHHNAYTEVDRRDFMKLAGASMAFAGLTACTRQPMEKIVPYVNAPEEIIPGKPLFYATAMTLGGYGLGLLAESHMGRPTKLEGNPEHPASLGATDTWAQASILDMYDPDRSQQILHMGRIGSWEKFSDTVAAAMLGQGIGKGDGIRILSETQSSPTLQAQWAEVKAKYPGAQWIQYDPVNRDSVWNGSKLAFGEHVETVYAFDKADVIVSIDSDFLHTGPGRIRYARDFASRRDPAGKMNRLYVVESKPSVTGTCADHRRPAGPDDVENHLRAIAAKLGIANEHRSHEFESGAPKKWLDAVVGDLTHSQGHSIVIAGDDQPASVHALCHAVNDALGNIGKTVRYTEPVTIEPGDQNSALTQLTNDMEAGKIKLLFILGGNPVYNAPVDLDFTKHLKNVDTRIHLGNYFDETAEQCHWHIPNAHYLEAWSDVRAFDGTVSLVQPLIKPLYRAKSIHDVFGAMVGKGAVPGYEIVKEFWKTKLTEGNFEKQWRRCLHDGVIPGTVAKNKAVKLQDFDKSAPPASDRLGMDVLFVADASLLDGRFANNGWLQELPKPISKLVWDNCVQLSPNLAEKNTLVNGDMVSVTYAGRKVEGPIWIMPGQSDDVVVLTLGFGRAKAGSVGTGVGFNTYGVRTSLAPSIGKGASLKKLGRNYPLASTQLHHTMDEVNEVDHEAKHRNLIRTANLEDYKKDPERSLRPYHEHPPEKDGSESFYHKKRPYDYSKGEQWGMVVNLNACTGCNACLVACNSENNIPVVGKDQVARGREMHWIRIDRYFDGDLENPKIHHQPMNCQHCENASCEPVCPVGATVHSHDGLNQMVYNRCVGTRYCSNNCPYKVRRFNFYQFTDLTTPSKKLMRNPDVTVRVRGVMEKCTYCVQRISSARIEAKKQNREIAEGEVVTACQSVCPTKAISFGNINDKNSEVARQKASNLNYTLLSDLNTLPRTSYLAKIGNPNPALLEESADHGHKAEKHS